MASPPSLIEYVLIVSIDPPPADRHRYNKYSRLTDVMQIAIVGSDAFCVLYGVVPKWLKGPHSKCGRSGNRREGSNPSNSVFIERLSNSALLIQSYDLFFDGLRHHAADALSVFDAVPDHRR